MTCSDIQSRLFYEAEDDQAAEALLEQHLAECRDCSREHAAYRTLVQACKDEPALLQTPAYVPPTNFVLPWRWIRVAAVITFLILGSLLRSHFQERDTRSVTQHVARPSWDLAIPSSIVFTSDQESLNFRMQVNSLHDQIVELRSRTAADQF